jgi:hypothetical protein
MPTDSFTDALERLDPASRALLDLSLRRGMRTEEIAEVLGADPDSVAASRDEALRRVAEDVGMPGHHQVDEVRARLAELPADDWLGRAATNGAATAASALAEARIETAPVEPLPAPVALLQPATEQAEGGGQTADGTAEAPEAEEVAEPEETATTTRTSAEPRERRRVLPVLLGLLVVAGVIVAVVLGSGGNGGKKASSAPSAAAPASKPKPAKPQPQPKPPSPGARVAAFGAAANVSGTARIAGDHLVLDVSGLPAPRGGYYEVWLYNSLIDAASLGKSQSGHIKLDAKLPGDWKRYRFVDVSREPNDGNASPSGESVARVPVSRLAR